LPRQHLLYPEYGASIKNQAYTWEPIRWISWSKQQHCLLISTAHTHTHTHTCISSLLPCFGFEKQWGERLESWWVNVSCIICSLIYGYILYTHILNICIATIFRVWGQFCVTLLEEVHLYLYTSSSTILFVFWVPRGVLHMGKNWAVQYTRKRKKSILQTCILLRRIMHTSHLFLWNCFYVTCSQTLCKYFRLCTWLSSHVCFVGKNN
jgi:hypothetical protein